MDKLFFDLGQDYGVRRDFVKKSGKKLLNPNKANKNNKIKQNKGNKESKIK
jgi:hypothetical protein